MRRRRRIETVTWSYPDRRDAVTATSIVLQLKLDGVQETILNLSEEFRLEPVRCIFDRPEANPLAILYSFNAGFVPCFLQMPKNNTHAAISDVVCRRHKQYRSAPSRKQKKMASKLRNLTPSPG
jgi:hypothetical protein